jgi:hypothetical protein
MNINQHMSVAMQQLVDFISMVTQQYVTTQQFCNALLVGFSIGQSIRNSSLLCKPERFSVGRSGTYKRITQAEPTRE